MLMKRIVMLGLIAMLVTTATTSFAERKFSQYKGRALKFGIPLYEGNPPEEYKYKSLGPVKGEYKSTFTDSAASTMSKALENLATKAKDMGANAVIKIEPKSSWSAFTYEGEAVIFENYLKKSN